MNKKILILIVVILIIAAGIGAYFIFQKPTPEPQTEKCGDGVCDNFKKANPNLCPEDCGEKPSATTTPSPYQDSPFGFLDLYTAPRQTQEQLQKFLQSVGVSSIEEFMDRINTYIKDLNFGFARLAYYWQAKEFPHDNIKKAHEAGLDLMITIYPPLTYPSDEKGWIDRVVNAVEAYDGDGLNDYSDITIKYWQVANESNFQAHWTDTPENYAKLLSITYDAIKSADPDAVVILGSEIMPSGTGIIPGVSETFFSDVFKSLGNKKKFDIVDLHYYGTASKSIINGKIQRTHIGIAKQVDDFRKKLSDAGYSDKTPIWISETGTYATKNIEPPWVPQTEKEQAIEMVKIYVVSFGKKIEKVLWALGIMDVPWWEPGGNFFRHTGLIYANDSAYPEYARESPGNTLWTKKLSYYTYKKMVEILEGSDWENIQVIQEKDDVYIYKFIKAGKPIWVAWNDNSQEKQITISGITSSQVKITEVVPKYESGKEVADYNTAFNTETKSVQAGKITLTLKDKPVFMEEK